MADSGPLDISSWGLGSRGKVVGGRFGRGPGECAYCVFAVCGVMGLVSSRYRLEELIRLGN